MAGYDFHQEGHLAPTWFTKHSVLAIFKRGARALLFTHVYPFGKLGSLANWLLVKWSNSGSGSLICVVDAMWCRKPQGISEGVLLRSGQRLDSFHTHGSPRNPARVSPASAERGSALLGAQGAFAMAVPHSPRLPCCGAGARSPHPSPSQKPLSRAGGAVPGGLLLGQLLGHQVHFLPPLFPSNFAIVMYPLV